jgi:YedE family putative selenium metabolism protein
MFSFLKRHFEIILTVATGIAIGVGGTCLACVGNPRNSGICISCFMENLAGAMGFHDNVRMQYIRPELLGFVLGAAITAVIAREFKARGGSSPMLRFAGGVLMIVGCSMFLGCPIRMVLRLGNGDFTALAGVVGLVFGVWVGFQFLRHGFHLGDTKPLPLVNGLVVPLLMAGLLVAWFTHPAFIHFSQVGPGAQKAKGTLALGSGLFIGVLAQRSRFCLTGGIGNFIASRDGKLLSGIVSMLVFAFLASYLRGLYEPGFEGQPGSHLAYGWSFLGMALVGIVSIMMEGCPFRQLILAGQGNSDAGAAVFGMLGGGAIVQGWGLTSTNLGPTVFGQVATLMGLALVLLTGLFLRVRD